MKTAQIKLHPETKQPLVEGDFEFKISDKLSPYNGTITKTDNPNISLLDKDYIPTKTIQFEWSMESPDKIKNDIAIELLAERLKQNFITFFQNNNSVVGQVI